MGMMNEPDLFSSTADEPGNTVRVLYLDTETTGADPGSADICEVALLLSTYNGFERCPGEDEIFESLVKPSEEVPPEASAIHHITNDMLADKPSIGELAAPIAGLAGKADIVCAHNLDYDITILGRRLPGIFDFPVERRLDSLRLARHLWPLVPSHSLQSLRYRFRLDSGLQGDAHRALFDTMLVRALVEHALQSGPPDAGDWTELVTFANSPLEIKVFSFGKYRGKLVEDVTAQDPDYVKWLLRQEWMPAEHPDLYHTILSKMGDGDRQKCPS